LFSFFLFDTFVFISSAINTSSADAAHAIAVKCQSGIGVFLINSSETASTYRVDIKLPRGLYGIEAKTLPGTGDVYPRRSQALADIGVRSITGTLNPKSVTALKIVNLLSDARDELLQVCSYPYQTALSDRLQNRILNCLSQTRDRVDLVENRLGKTDRANLTKEIHRGMLLTGQAEAMLRNAASQGQLIGSTGDKINNDLTSLQNALSKISAACFDVFPMVTIESSVDDTNPTMIILTLVNRGTAPISLINFSLDPPENWTSCPIGYTLFSRLGPGESLSGRFAIGMPSDAVPGSLVSVPGEISYFSNHSAAHLKVVATVKVPDAKTRN
jgi:hypothetical protein